MVTGAPTLRRGRPQTWLVLSGGIGLELIFYYLHRLNDLELYVVETIAAGLAAGLLYFICLYVFEHAQDTRTGFWLILAAALLFRCTLWPLAPTLSEDLYRYRWDGRIQVAGWNPYAVRPDDSRLAQLREPAVKHFPGEDLRAIYPPLAELTFREGARYLRSPMAFKMVVAGADVLTLFLLAAWLRREHGRNYQLAIYAWNPLVIVEFAGSGHSDALALALLVLAFLILPRRPVISTLSLACAALYKSFAVMLFPLWLRRIGWPRSSRAWAGVAGSAGLAFVCAWPYRSAISQIPATMAHFESRWQDNNSSLYALLRAFSESHELAAGIGVGIVIGLALWAAARKMEPLRAGFLIMGAILMLTPNAYSWYFTWIVPLLCFIPSTPWLLLTVLQFLSYHVLIKYEAFGLFQFDHKYVFLTYAPFYGWLLAQSMLGRGADGD
jgi:alpha-1,6-mannosyltransferase